MIISTRHGPTLYNGHLQRYMTLTPVAERLAVDMSVPVSTTYFCLRTGMSNKMRTLEDSELGLDTMIAFIYVCMF